MRGRGEEGGAGVAALDPGADAAVSRRGVDGRDWDLDRGAVDEEILGPGADEVEGLGVAALDIDMDMEAAIVADADKEVFVEVAVMGRGVLRVMGIGKWPNSCSSRDSVGSGLARS